MLKQAFFGCNLSILLTTGRSGTDFLQSLYDQHPEVITTCEKSLDLHSFIANHASIAQVDPNLFAHLSVTHLKESFAPYIDSIEGWNILPNDSYNKADPRTYVSNLAFLLDSGLASNPLLIAKSIFISFAYALSAPPSHPRTVLFHLHHIYRLHFFLPYLEDSDRLIVCSRNSFSLLHSGVFGWCKYWKSRGEYTRFVNLGHYRYILSRTFNDHILLSSINVQPGRAIMPVLDRLNDLEYLNRVNAFLGISTFQEYPDSTVFGIPRRPDKLSAFNNSKETIKAASFNKEVVNRGNPIRLLGYLETMLICATHSERLLYYKQQPNQAIFRLVIRLPRAARAIIVILLLPYPTKIERSYISNTFYVLLHRAKLSSPLPVNRLFYTIAKNLLVLIQIRIDRIKHLSYNKSKLGFIPEP